MKMVKSLLLGTAAGLVALTGAQAADLPVKAKPVQYVKICSLYGAGFYYIPGTDTCIKIGGFVRAEMNFNANGSFAQFTSVNFSDRRTNFENTRVRWLISADARTQTEYGTLRAYFNMAEQVTNHGGGSQSAGNGNDPANWANRAFIQLAGFTAGLTDSFFDFDNFSYSNQTNLIGSSISGGGIPVFAYTAQFGNGLSASISAEDTRVRRTDIDGDAYAGGQIPDIVGNLRIDQAWGSAQIMGAAHQIRVVGDLATGAHADDKVGWAAGAGLKLNVPMLGKADYAIAQFTYSEGAINYVGNHLDSFNIRDGYPLATGATRAVGPVNDAVLNGAGDLDLVKGWSVTGGFEHHWVPGWKTSLYGAFAALNYDDTALTSDANFQVWQVGSRTVWTPVQNLDLSVDVIYNNVNTAFDAVPGNEDKHWLAGMFRIQRNFYP
jgi:hypothetical protein